MRKKLKTMTELSDAIDISRPTLSRYFQDPNSVRPSTRNTIERGLQQFDYVPSFFARNMNRKKTRLLGIVVPTIGDRFYASLVEEIENHARQKDYTVIIQNSSGDSTLEGGVLEKLRSMNAEGVIIAPVSDREATNRYDHLNADLPLVFVDSKPQTLNAPYPFVGTDNHQSIRVLVDYLCRTGKPPVFMGMPQVNCNSSERLSAYRTRMEDLGHTPQLISNEGRVTWDFEEYAYSLLRKNFARGKLIESTILCANDRLAMGALRAANEYGLFRNATGEESKFRVAGHDNHPLSGFLWPPLTTVAQDVQKMARIAFELFLAQTETADGKPSARRDYLLNAELIIRSSA